MLEKLLEAIVGLTAALAAHTAALAANPTKPAKAKPAEAATPATTGQPATTTAQPIAAAIAQANTQTLASSAATAGQATGAAPSPEAVGALMVRVANEVTRDAAVAILGKYGASGFGGVKPGDYVPFYADCVKALEVFGQSGLPVTAARTEAQSAALTASVLNAVGLGKPANAAAGLM
jgi:hypothetical protein